TSGRMVELIENGQPALMLCHWPGMYCNGTKSGFRSFQNVVTALDSRFRDQTQWMKLSEIARYWAAKELTEINRTGKDRGWSLKAPFAAPQFTLRIPSQKGVVPRLLSNRNLSAFEKITVDDKVTAGGYKFSGSFREVKKLSELNSGTWFREGKNLILCFDLPKGHSLLLFS
ncbi:MAG: hypothetical protein KDA84_04665, partial [Planctomycetaceae bacterium]|nr:hypothetical protein [Planctomycetaceae bacterium]